MSSKSTTDRHDWQAAENELHFKHINESVSGSVSFQLRKDAVYMSTSTIFADQHEMQSAAEPFVRQVGFII